MKAVIVGAGRIGCGYAGQVLRAAGHEVVFLVRDAHLAEHLNRHGRYLVRVTSNGAARDHEVDGVRAVAIADQDEVARQVSSADLLATAVGCGNLEDAASLLAGGMAMAARPCNVLAFENAADAGQRLRARVATVAGPAVAARHGFATALVMRVVARRVGSPASEQPLVFVGDAISDCIVDRRGLVGELPAVPELRSVDDFAAWVRRKLFMFSAGHATAAYLGQLKGYRYVHTAMRDAEIREAVLEAMREGQRGLRAEYGDAIAGGEEEILRNAERFANAALDDPVERVGRDPIRKLGAQDRLVGPAYLAARAGERPDKLLLAIAAALFFWSATDPAAASLRREVEFEGPGRTLARVAQLAPEEPLSRGVVAAWSRLAKGWHVGGPLLSLDKVFWA